MRFDLSVSRAAAHRLTKSLPELKLLREDIVRNG